MQDSASAEKLREHGVSFEIQLDHLNGVKHADEPLDSLFILVQSDKGLVTGPPAPCRSEV